MRLWLDKIASATGNVPLKQTVRVTPEIIAQEGYVIAGRIHGVKSVYNQLENTHGRLVSLHEGDVIAGVLGQRNALQGYAGYVPDAIKVGDTLQLLNMGGVIGTCTSMNPDVGPPFDVEVLGAVQVFPEFEQRTGVPAHIKMNAIGNVPETQSIAPVVYIVGTCMNSGKTAAACRLIREFAKAGKSVGACKLTGVSLRRDALKMGDYGAKATVTFTDAGIPATTAENAVPVARNLLRELSRQGAEMIVAELGDGLLGEYGVAEILSDPVLKQAGGAYVLCANDPVGAWGAQQLMRNRFDLPISVITGPTTDNAVGTEALRKRLEVAAINARTHSRELGQHLLQHLTPQEAGA